MSVSHISCLRQLVLPNIRQLLTPLAVRTDYNITVSWWSDWLCVLTAVGSHTHVLSVCCDRSAGWPGAQQGDGVQWLRQAVVQPPAYRHVIEQQQQQPVTGRHRQLLRLGRTV